MHLGTQTWCCHQHHRNLQKEMWVVHQLHQTHPGQLMSLAMKYCLKRAIHQIFVHQRTKEISAKRLCNCQVVVESGACEVPLSIWGWPSPLLHLHQKAHTRKWRTTCGYMSCTLDRLVVLPCVWLVPKANSAESPPGFLQMHDQSPSFGSDCPLHQSPLLLHPMGLPMYCTSFTLCGYNRWRPLMSKEQVQQALHSNNCNFFALMQSVTTTKHKMKVRNRDHKV